MFLKNEVKICRAFTHFYSDVLVLLSPSLNFSSAVDAVLKPKCLTLPFLIKKCWGESSTLRIWPVLDPAPSTSFNFYFFFFFSSLFSSCPMNPDPPKTSAWVYLRSVGWKRVFAVNKANQMLTSSTDTRALDAKVPPACAWLSVRWCPAEGEGCPKAWGPLVHSSIAPRPWRRHHTSTAPHNCPDPKAEVIKPQVVNL